MADLFLGRKSINHPSVWDPTQFKIQPDGSFRISIRGMAAMAGVDDGSLSRSLKSAAAENALPCARSLALQGFDPAAVSSWGETGGIPENAAPFILEHYGISATTPSTLARTVLLSFSRVGINAYLKERLGMSRVRENPALVESHKADTEFAVFLSDIVGKVGGDPKESLAISFTILARKHPGYKDIFLENQKLLCPTREAFGNPTQVLECLEKELGVETITRLTCMAKDGGLIHKNDKRLLVNAILCERKLQFNTGIRRRGAAAYATTEEGAKYAREETRPAQYADEGAWVPQLLWKLDTTANVIVNFIKDNVKVS
jgi:hypothetical protein